MQKNKIMAVVATRPDAIKMCPLINELREESDLEVTVCSTGQHRDMVNGVLELFGLRADFDLAVMKPEQDLFDITLSVLEGMKKLLRAQRPKAVIVHGDTTSAFASSLAAFYEGIPVYHVEAGLRTYDLSAPFPEEFNRRAISVIADKHLAPTASAKENLLSEGIAAEDVEVTGNTITDALAITVTDKYRSSVLQWAEDGRLILLTAHRRENLSGALDDIFSAIKRITLKYPDVKILYPVHPNPKIRALAEDILGDCPSVRLCPPMDVADFHNVLSRCYLVLTDSGGIQEEAAALHKPTLVLRNTTERVEELRLGALRLVGTNESTVYRGICSLLDNKALYYAMSRGGTPPSYGKVSRHIVDILKRTV